MFATCVFMMRVCGVFTLLAALILEGAAKPDNDVSKISNIQLLMPISMTDISQRSSLDGIVQSLRHETRQYRDRDEPYSSIPAYAFKLDDDQSQVPQNRASYMEVWSEHSDKRRRNHNRLDRKDLVKTTKYACTSLKHRPQGSLGELLLALCHELIDELAMYYDSCDGDN